jgi:hypothetical protein
MRQMSEPRDIEKDKEFLSQWPETLVLVNIPLYYIALCEAQQARIAELEQQLQLHNRPDVTNMQEHDTKLEQLFTDLYGGITFD